MEIYKLSSNIHAVRDFPGIYITRAKYTNGNTFYYYVGFDFRVHRFDTLSAAKRELVSYLKTIR